MIDPAELSPSTCLLCLQPALEWQGNTCSCVNCEALFEFDPPSRTLYYTHLPEVFAPYARELQAGWLPRERVLEIVHGPPPDPPEPTLAQPVASGPTPNGTGAVLTVAALVALALALAGIFFVRPRLAPTAVLTPTAPASPMPTLTMPTPTAVPAPTRLPSATAPLFPTLTPSPQPFATAAAPSAVQTADAAASATSIAATNAQTQRATGTPTSAPLLVNSPIPPSATSPPATATPLPPTFTPVPPSATPTPAATDTPAPAADTPTATGTPATAAPEATNTATATAAPPTATVAATSTLTTTATATSTPVPPVIVIMSIRFVAEPDRPETEEYVEIRNTTNVDIPLRDWTIYSSVTDESYRIEPTLVLLSGQSCRLYSGGKPTQSACAVNLQETPPDGNLWTPVSAAELRDQSRKLIDRCRIEQSTTSTLRPRLHNCR